MNLGEICIQTALAILALGFLFGAIITAAYLLVSRKRVLSRTLLFGTILVGLALGGIGLGCFHQPLFRMWHRLQNDAVPSTGCVDYEPSFWHLYAVYKMDQQSFSDWVAAHPWNLTQCKPDAIFQFHDGPHFGLTSCEAVYESPRGPKGNNLRVYYQNGLVYISYSVM